MGLIIADDEKKAFSVCNEGSRYPVIITVEHASNYVAKSLDNLGLSNDILETHIAYDLFAKEFSYDLAKEINCPLIACEYSRLVVDCNRVPDSKELFREVSDGIEITGNINISEEVKEARVKEIFEPFHNAVANIKSGYINDNINFSFLSIHSFTPALSGGDERPWDIGLMWDNDDTLARKFYSFLQENYSDLVFDFNVPYNPQEDEGGSMHIHAYPDNIPTIEIELNQKTMADEVKYKKLLSAFVEFFGDVNNL